MFCAEDEEVVWVDGQTRRGDEREEGERREAEVRVIRLGLQLFKQAQHPCPRINDFQKSTYMENSFTGVLGEV